MAQTQSALIVHLSALLSFLFSLCSHSLHHMTGPPLWSYAKQEGIIVNKHTAQRPALWLKRCNTAALTKRGFTKHARIHTWAQTWGLASVYLLRLYMVNKAETSASNNSILHHILSEKTFSDTKDGM